MTLAIVSRLLRVYRKYLARFVFFRLLKALLLGAYRSSYRLRSLLARQSHSGFYRFLSLNDCSDALCVKRITFDQGETMEIPPPVFSGYSSQTASERNLSIKINSPKLDVFMFSSATVVGGVDFVFINKIALHHDLFIPSQHHCPAENVGVVFVSRDKNRLRLCLTHKTKKVPMAVTMIGQCSGNYAHWLTETLPKLPVLDTCGEFSDLPLLVDDGLHPNFYASIDLVSRNHREVIAIRRWEPVLVDKLVTISHPGYERYVPHGIHFKEVPAYINTFSRTALMMLRDAAGSALEGYPRLRAKGIYLARSENSKNIRQIENLSAVKAAISACGIHLIMPELMDFKEQVASCIDAEIIVAPVGASLANMIFAPPGCKVIVLAPYYDEASYFYYSNLAGVLGHELHYVLGIQMNESQHPIHRNYHIDVEVLMATLEHAISGAQN